MKTATKKAPVKKAAKKAPVKKAKTYKTYTDITSFEDACRVMKYDPKKCLPQVSGMPADLQRNTTDGAKLKIIIQAINTVMKWKADYVKCNNKYYPYWWTVQANKKQPSGFGLSSASAYYDGSRTDVGPRLCVGSSDQALYLARQFEDLYVGMLL